MPLTCFVVDCAAHAVKESASFFRIPSIISKNNKQYSGTCNERELEEVINLSIRRQQSWIRVLKRGKLSETQLRNARICNKHFITGRPADIKDVNNPDWTPNKNLGYSVGVNLKRDSDFDRYERAAKRTKARENVLKENENAMESRNLSIENQNLFQESMEIDDLSTDFIAGVSTQTDLSVIELTKMFERLTLANYTIEKLENRIKKLELSEESFINDNSKTKFFTGLDNSEVLFLVHDLISTYLYNRSNALISTFQQLLLTLMKLRLNLSLKYLAYRFGISPNTASRYFRRCLHILYCKLKSLIIWPNRDILYSTMPQCFHETFGNNISTIIDCFEVFIESPRNLYSSAQCWSNYKHHKTAKILIAITPQGTVCFVSDAWGGRVSDKRLTENSGLLDLLLPGDVVLADRGFLIGDSVKSVGATLKIPCFTKGKAQLHPKELEETRSVAHVRIHVERVIGSIRQKYQILTDTVPISLLRIEKMNVSMFDEIVTVCCALVNLCTSMVVSS